MGQTTRLVRAGRKDKERGRRGDRSKWNTPARSGSEGRLCHCPRRQAPELAANVVHQNVLEIGESAGDIGPIYDPVVINQSHVDRAIGF